MLKSALYSFTMQFWFFILRFAFVPWYISVLGFDAYSIILLFTLIQTWLLILDYGLTPIFAVEFAQYLEKLSSYSELRGFVRTVEFAFIFLGLTIFSQYFFSLII